MNTKLSRQEKEKYLVNSARKYLGKPYKFGSKPYEAPRRFDCSSFVQYLYKQIGIKLPRVSIMQAECGKKISNIKKIKTGDLIFFKGIVGRYNEKFPQGIGHVGLYAGDKKIIHAAGKIQRKGGRVMEEPLHIVVKSRGPIVIIRRLF